MDVDKFLENIFIEKFLNLHQPVINAYSDLLATEYNGSGSGYLSIGYKMYKKLLPETKIEQVGIFSFKSKAFRNLRNAWYNETALNHPEIDGSDVLFVPWKISQFYYTLFVGTSAVVRTFNQTTVGHEKIINLFNSDFINCKKYQKAVIYPFNIFVNQTGQIKDEQLKQSTWQYGIDNHLPKLVNGLKFAKSGKSGIASTLDYFHKLRNWSTYEDPYIFFRIYGKQLRNDFYFYLKNIAKFYLFMIETIMIKFHGYTRILDQKKIFSEQMLKHLEVEANELELRFKTHQKYVQ